MARRLSGGRSARARREPREPGRWGHGGRGVSAASECGLAVCHRSFLIAASLIGRGHPDDAVGTTRCAVEGARVAFGVHHDEQNWKRWAAYGERLSRWKDREDNLKPKRVSPKLDLPVDHEHLERLGKWLGILSDTLHFTPEFIGNHQPEMRPDQAFVHYFTDDATELERALRCLAAVHLPILEVFDEAFGGAFSRSDAWCDAIHAIGAAGTQLCDAVSVPETATTETTPGQAGLAGREPPEAGS